VYYTHFRMLMDIRGLFGQFRPANREQFAKFGSNDLGKLLHLTLSMRIGTLLVEPGVGGK